MTRNGQQGNYAGDPTIWVTGPKAMHFLTPAICPVHADRLMHSRADVLGNSTETARFHSGPLSEVGYTKLRVTEVATR